MSKMGMRYCDVTLAYNLVGVRIAVLFPCVRIIQNARGKGDLDGS